MINTWETNVDKPMSLTKYIKNRKYFNAPVCANSQIDIVSAGWAILLVALIVMRTAKI